MSMFTGRAVQVAAALTTTTVALAGCGDAKTKTGTGVDDAALATTAAADAAGAKAADALQQNDVRLAGWMSPDAARDVGDCSVAAGQPADFDCAVGLGDGMEPSWVRIRLQLDGTATKLLAGATPTAGRKASAETEQLLADDDREMDAPTAVDDYRCAPSPRIEPDGKPATSSSKTAGQRCIITQRVPMQQRVRYVEFAPDGTALRDYMLPVP